MSKKRSKKFGKKRAPAAMADGGVAADAQLGDADSSDDSDDSDEGLMAAAALQADDAAVIAEPGLVEGALATDAVAPDAAPDETGLVAADAFAHEATAKRRKKGKKTAAPAAASEAVAAAKASDDPGELDAALEVDAGLDVAPALDVDAVVADTVVADTHRSGKKVKTAKVKGTSKRAVIDTNDDAETLAPDADADAHDMVSGGAGDGIDVEMLGTAAPTDAELAAAGYLEDRGDASVDARDQDSGEDSGIDEAVVDAIDGIDAEMPELVEGDGSELAAAGEGEDAESELPAAAAAMDAAQLAQLIEALIFATDKPLTLQRIRQLTRVADATRITAALAKIAIDYADRGIVLSSVSGGYQFRTRSQFSSWVQQLIAGRPVRLSRAQLEALAIIAYRQPITRPEIDEIRGVDSGGTLKVLLDRQLIRSLGKKEEVGRPVLYGTTKEFLDFFSLGDLRELPTLREYSELTDESRSVMKKMGLDAPEIGVVSEHQGLAPDAAAAFEALANAAEIAEEFGDIGEVGDIDEVSDFGVDAQFVAASSRSGLMEDDADAADGLAADDLDAGEPLEAADDLDVGDTLEAADDLDSGEAQDAAEALDAVDDLDSGDAQEALEAADDLDSGEGLAGDDVNTGDAFAGEVVERLDFVPPNHDVVDDDDEDIELPSWVVPVSDEAAIEIENHGPGRQMHGDRDEDEALDVEVTRDGEWVAGASELVEPTDEVAAEQFDDEAS